MPVFSIFPARAKTFVPLLEGVPIAVADAPMSIYEVHLGSWMRVPEEGNRSLTYREIAPMLAEYVTRMGFTHV